MRTTPGRWRLLAATVVGSLVLSAGPMFAAVGVTDRGATAAAAEAVVAGPNLAAGKTMTASGVRRPTSRPTPTTATRAPTGRARTTPSRSGCRSTSASSVSNNQVVLQAADRGWGARTQTLAVQGSTNGTTFTDLVASAGVHVQPGVQQHRDDHYTAATTRYLRLNITANTGWPAGQISEFEVYGPAPAATPSRRPRRRAWPTPSPATGQIRLTWNASTDNVGVTGYDVYANGALRTSVGRHRADLHRHPAGTATVTYYVRAQDAAGNQSPQQQHRHPHRNRRRRHEPGRRQADHRSRPRLHLRRGQRQRQQRRPPTGRAAALPEHADRRSSAPTRTSARSSSS